MSEMSLGEEARTEMVLNGAANKINNSKETPKKKNNSKGSLLEKWVAFVNNNNLAIKRDGKLYLRVEAWNYLFAQKGLAPTILELKTQTSITKNEDGEEESEIIYIAKAGLIPMTAEIETEIPVGATALAACKVGESDFSDDYYSAMSMAQTRAVGKLGRTVFGHLAIACGFQACPLEEMPVEKKK